MPIDDRLEGARQAYERVVFGGDVAGLDEALRGLDGVEADACLARGRLVHARHLCGEGQGSPAQQGVEELGQFEQARRLYDALGDRRGAGEALLWLGLCHQVVLGDNSAALPLLKEAHDLAADTGDRMTMSYALRHLGIADHAAGLLSSARERLEESTQIRRDLDFGPGVAANLVGLAHIAVDEDRPADAARLARRRGRRPRPPNRRACRPAIGGRTARAPQERG